MNGIIIPRMVPYVCCLLQAPTASTITGPATTKSGDSTFTLFINVTYSTAAVQLLFLTLLPSL